MTQSAKVTQVQIGNIEIEGLLLEDGSFGVAVSQIADLIQDTRNYISQTLKRLLGKDFKTHKVKTPFNKKPVNVVDIKTFELILAKLDRNGNKIVQDLRDDMVGLSLQQLFSDAFGVKFESEDRQRWLKSRVATKDTFFFLTDDIRDWLIENPDVSQNTKKFIYSNVFDSINLGLFGKKSKEIRESLGVKDNELIRDHMNDEALDRIKTIQRLVKANIKKGNNPLDSVKSALEAFEFDIIDYRKLV